MEIPIEIVEASMKLFRFLATYDFWSFASFILLIAGSIVGYLKFYRPHKRINNFLVWFHCERAEGWNFPFRILVQFTNHTGNSVHISSASFKCKGLRPDPNSSVDSSTGKIPLKFPKKVMRDGIAEAVLDHFEHDLRVDDTVHSYAPIDPKHTNEEAERAFLKGEVGTLYCYVTLLPRDRKPSIYQLKVSPKKQLSVRVLPQEE
jgi:hypothetical protein